MKIMVYNTQHCELYHERKIDFERISGIIRESGADFVGLNEIRGKGITPEYEEQTEILSRLTGMEHSFFARAIYVNGTEPYGNALLSRWRIESAQVIPVPDPERIPGRKWYESRCLLKTKLSCGLTVLVIHFGLNPDEQENAVRTVLENLEDERCVLMGDFNLTPTDPLLDPIRVRMKDTADAFDGERLSFPSDVPNRKIDYIFVTPDIEVVSADIPAIVCSDHRPYVAEIRF